MRVIKGIKGIDGKTFVSCYPLFVREHVLQNTVGLNSYLQSWTKAVDTLFIVVAM